VIARDISGVFLPRLAQLRTKRTRRWQLMPKVSPLPKNPSRIEANHSSILVVALLKLSHAERYIHL